MRRPLTFIQLGRAKTVFVHGNYPLTDQDAQAVADTGLITPSKIINKLHQIGMKRMMGH